MFESKITETLNSAWFPKIQVLALENAGLYLLTRNEFATCFNEFGPKGVVPESYFEIIFEAQQKIENTIDKLEIQNLEVRSIPNPKGKIESGLFDWSKVALSAQFDWAVLAYNAYIHWIKQVVAGNPWGEAFDFYKANIYDNFYYTQYLPRTLDYLATEKKWPPRSDMDKMKEMNRGLAARNIGIYLNKAINS